MTPSTEISITIVVESQSIGSSMDLLTLYTQLGEKLAENEV